MAKDFEAAVHEFFMDLKGQRVLHYMGSTASYDVAVISQLIKTEQTGTSGPYFRALLQSTNGTDRTKNMLFMPGTFQWRDHTLILSEHDVTITLPARGAAHDAKALLGDEPIAQRAHESAAGSIPTYTVPDTPEELLSLLMRRHGDHPDF